MLAHLLEERVQLLKIMSMNHYDMETGSRPEHLRDFKVAWCIDQCGRGMSDKYFQEMTVSEKQDFIYTFFPFMFGIYPYTYVAENSGRRCTLM